MDFIFADGRAQIDPNTAKLRMFIRDYAAHSPKRRLSDSFGSILINNAVCSGRHQPQSGSALCFGARQTLNQMEQCLASCRICHIEVVGGKFTRRTRTQTPEVDYAFTRRLCSRENSSKEIMKALQVMGCEHE